MVNKPWKAPERVKGYPLAVFVYTRTDVDTDVYEGARCVYASSDESIEGQTERPMKM